MNMKRMTTVVAMATAIQVATGVVTAAYGDVSVEDVKCAQRYPWNGLVDIEYTIACDDPEAEIYVNAVGFNGDTGLTVFPTHFTGDGATNTVKAGKHTMVWDARADMGNLFATKNFQIKMYAGKKLSRYIVIDISGGTAADNYPIRHSIDGPDLADDTCRTTEIWMRLIPPGTFMMGSPADELGRSSNEDLHKVTITKPYYMGVFEVTQRQWELVMGNRPSYFSNNDHYATRPVEYVKLDSIRNRNSDGSPSYPNASILGGGLYQLSTSFLQEIQGKTGCAGINLPTEAQWEYAARLGNTRGLTSGMDISATDGCARLNELGRYAFNGYNGKSYGSDALPSLTTAKVGSYLPNAYGLYDMHGNVWEICRDYSNGSLGTKSVVDPIGTSAGTNARNQWIIRGGGWTDYASGCRLARRSSFQVCGYYSNTTPRYNTYSSRNTIGFRLCGNGEL